MKSLAPGFVYKFSEGVDEFLLSDIPFLGRVPCAD